MTLSPWWQDALLLAGRCLLVVIFLYSGIDKAVHFKAGLAEIGAKHLPLPRLALLGTIALQLVAGALIAVGHFVPLASFALAAFTLATAVVFYDFWTRQGAERVAMFNGFLEHIAMIGGFLVLAAVGPGRFVL